MKKGMIVLLLIGLIIVGCAEEEKVKEVSVFEGGTQGLIASFEPLGVQEEGIYTIFDTETFPIEIVLRNKGEEDVLAEDATVRLKGINLADFENIPLGEKTNSQKIEKISEFNPGGGEEIIDFTPDGDAKYKGEVIGFYMPDIFASFEYKYKTRAIVPKVCFKEDPTDPSVCELKEGKPVFVSGAPVTVKKVTEDYAGRGIIILSFEVENVGGGKVTKIGKEFDSRYGKMGFEIRTEPEKWDCRSAGRENEARLVEGKATIICKLKEKLEKGTLYTKQIELNLDYLYKDVIQETLKIKESIK